MYRFDEYRAAVLLDYEERKAANRLSHELTHPTAANLREEAVNACHTRFDKSDEKVLVSFFQRREDSADYARVIGKGEVNCFRALRNFLNGETSDPAERQVELLAWLTDFKPRPYQEYIRVIPPVKKPNGPQRVKIFIQKKIDEGKLLYTKHPIGLSISLLLALVLVVIYLPLPIEKCIRWDGRQYEVIACDAFPGDPSVIPYDRVKLKEFKMVLRYDTLTTYSFGKVWYAKRKGEYEFFTASGVHPLYRDIQLKPLSDYILNTVIRKKQQQLLLNGH